MISADIIDFLEDNGLSEIEELKVSNNYLVLKFFYDFDKAETDGAKAYANEESDVEEESTEWYKDWFYPYLLDMAKDNALEIVEELEEEFEISTFLKETEVEGNTYDYVRFLLAVSTEEFSGDLDELLNDYL